MRDRSLSAGLAFIHDAGAGLDGRCNARARADARCFISAPATIGRPPVRS
jgi:hypothetical protein